MKISEPQLYKVYYTKKFDALFPINNDLQLILNDNFIIYALIDDSIYKAVDFDIYRDGEGKYFIHPNFPPEQCDEFLLCGERLTMCKTVELKAEDYISKIESDGSYTFVVEEDK